MMPTPQPDRVDELLQLLAAGQLSLKKQIGELTIAVGSFDRSAPQAAESDWRDLAFEDKERRRQFDEQMEKLDLEAKERGRRLDEKIARLLLDIREYIRRQERPRPDV